VALAALKEARKRAALGQQATSPIGILTPEPAPR